MAERNEIKTIPYYMIISKCSGMSLDIMEGSARMFYPLNTPLQHWSFEDRGNGCVTIINRGTHQVLDVDMAGVDNGTPVHMWQDINASNQLWMLEPVGENTYRIRAKHSRRYLDITEQSLNAGAHLNIWDATSSDTQLWIIREVIEESKPDSAAEAATAQPPAKRKYTRRKTTETAPAKKRKTRAPRGSRTKKTVEPAAPSVEAPAEPISEVSTEMPAETKE